MFNKEYHWNIDINQVLTINNNEDISIKIDEENLKDIFVNSNRTLTVINWLNKNKEFFDKIIFKDIKEDMDSKVSISLYKGIGSTEYDFGYDIKNIFNEILNKLNCIGNVTDIDYNDLNSISLFKKNIHEITENSYYFSLLDNDTNRTSILANLVNNADRIVDQMVLSNIALDKFIGKQKQEELEKRNNSKKIVNTDNTLIIPKNLMMYSAVKAIKEFEKTGDINYYRYAKDYYKNLSSNPNCEFPKSMKIDNEQYSFDFTSFNKLFKTVQYDNFPELLIELNLEDKEKINPGRTLKDGTSRQVIKMNGTSKNKKVVDYDKLLLNLKKKKEFYKILADKCQGTIYTFDNTNYYGFVLPNNYIVFEKFYDTNKDGSIRPSMDSAIYICTIDVFEKCNGDRGIIRKYIEKNHDFTAYRLYHNDTDSYQDKVKKVLEYKPSSFLTFDDIKDKYNSI